MESRVNNTRLIIKESACRARKDAAHAHYGKKDEMKCSGSTDGAYDRKRQRAGIHEIT
jgi:hypothetical protein